MAVIRFKQHGKWDKTTDYLNQCSLITDKKFLDKVAKDGLKELIAATPKKTGILANDWGYELIKRGKGYGILYTNSNVVNSVNIAILVDKGHMSKNGTWVAGQHFLDEAVKKVYEKVMNETWEELRKL
jgi:hypothetical protein